MDTPTTPATELICPRCGLPSAGRFYGPCPACRDELIEVMRREPEAVERPSFEPKMHVVANQVATKE
jgi:hypothetical protein